MNQASYIQLGYPQVLIAAALILVNGAISLALRLGLERSLLWAAVRTIVQLLLIGYVLQWVFSASQWYWVVTLMVIMTLAASHAATSRSLRRYTGILVDSTLAVWLSSWIITAMALFVIIRIHPWYRPQYAIPILGMILGNTLTGISLGMERMTEALLAQRGQVETLLALGATRWEAARLPAQQAVRAGMTPIINSMMVVGIVSLPGMMTGQMLAGQDPLQAVRYQIVIMFLIASGSALGTVGAVLLSFRRLFSPEHQFLAAAIHEARPRGKRG